MWGRGGTVLQSGNHYPVLVSGGLQAVFSGGCHFFAKLPRTLSMHHFFISFVNKHSKRIKKAEKTRRIQEKLLMLSIIYLFQLLTI
jgi:hypothetical protein